MKAFWRCLKAGFVGASATFVGVVVFVLALPFVWMTEGSGAVVVLYEELREFCRVAWRIE